MIEQLWTQGDQGIEGWRKAPLGDLVIHIIEQFHMPARVEMARMETLVEEAVLLEGAAHPGVLAVREEVGRFCREFRAHMAMEERSVFPQLLAAGKGAVGMPSLRVHLENGHEAETGLFRHLRDLSRACLPAPGARNLRARLNSSFRAMEKNLQIHLLLETQVLFRRVF